MVQQASLRQQVKWHGVELCSVENIAPLPVRFSASVGVVGTPSRREARNFLRAITSCRPLSLISETFGAANAIATCRCVH